LTIHIGRFQVSALIVFSLEWFDKKLVDKPDSSLRSRKGRKWKQLRDWCRSRIGVAWFQCRIA
jgi:hypothetical protein